MFCVPSEVHRGISRGRNPAPQSRNSTTEARKSDHRNSRATNPFNSNAWNEGHDWPDRPADGWGHYSEEDEKVRRHQIGEKKWPRRRNGIEKSRMAMCANGEIRRNRIRPMSRVKLARGLFPSFRRSLLLLSRPWSLVKGLNRSLFNPIRNPRPPKFRTPTFPSTTEGRLFDVS